MAKRAWRICLGVAIGIAAILLAGVLATALYVGPRVLEKGGAPRTMDRPERRIADPVPIEQTELHTCGFLSLSAAYVAYGLSPEEKNLRFRLGVDTKAHPFDDESTGTLHPDLYRVLAQDGFAIEAIDPDADDAAARLTAHLQPEGLALLLIKRRQTGGLHWVVADKAIAGSDGAWTHLRIVDSLASFPYREPIDDFLAHHVLSIIAIRPADDASVRGDVAKAHGAGLAEMKRVHARMKTR